jgi:hypothetical protein
MAYLASSDILSFRSDAAVHSRFPCVQQLACMAYQAPVEHLHESAICLSFQPFFLTCILFFVTKLAHM